MGKIMRVNMSESRITLEDIPQEYSGLAGRGLTSQIIAKEVPPACEPLGARNKLVIAPGALSGTNAANSGGLSIGLKSPLTGGIKESNVGGTAAFRLGRLGMNAIVIEGLPEKGAVDVAAKLAELSEQGSIPKGSIMALYPPGLGGHLPCMIIRWLA